MANRPVLGLSGYRWSNNVKSALLLALFPFILIGIVAAFFWGYGFWISTPEGMIPALMAQESSLIYTQTDVSPFIFALENTKAATLLVLGITVVWILIGSVFSDGFMRMASGGKGLDRAENPELYNLLENLCISRGMPMPKLNYIDTPIMNAFASGLGRDSFSITVTRGLVEKLDKDELEAVLAHELSHIINRDVRLLVVMTLFTGMLSFFAEMAWRGLRYSGFSSRRGKAGGGFVLLIAGIVLLVGYSVSVLFRLALSRRREYMADAGAVELTKRPESLITALQKISGNSDLPYLPSSMQAMLIDKPPDILSLFDTHPPIESRIFMLRQMAGQGEEKGESIIPETTKTS